MLRPAPPPVMIKDTDGVNTIWIPPTETQWEQQVANPHPRSGTCFYANLRRKIWVRVDADGFPVVIRALTPLPTFPPTQIHPSPGLDWMLCSLHASSSSASVPVQSSDLTSRCLANLLDAVQVRPLQQRMLADDESIVLEEVVVNSATAAPPATSVLQFGGTYLRARYLRKLVQVPFGTIDCTLFDDRLPTAIVSTQT